MKSINPIFIKVNGAKIDKPRQVRSDKTVDIKFPVTDEQWIALRRRAIAKEMGNKQTKYNTLLLYEVLQEGHLDQLNPIDYKDTGKYMHVKPAQLPHEKVQELMLCWGLSKRKTIHRLIMSVLR